MAKTIMTKCVLVTGKNGQLGQSLQKIANCFPEYFFCFVGREELNLSKTEAVQNYLEDKEFDIIINCAAYTAVDKAESEPELANKINHFAVKQLAEIAKNKNIILIHISTDYVFNGENFKPYAEIDTTDPQNVYGKTKLDGELAMLSENPKGMIIRTSWVYSEFGNNFVKTMLRLGKEKDELNIIYDQVGTPTYASDIANVILGMLSNSNFEAKDKGTITYHYSNEGVCSWYDFTKAIFEFCNISCQVNPMETKDYPTIAKRPHYSVLNKSKIKSSENIKIPYWKASLEVCLKLLNER